MELKDVLQQMMQQSQAAMQPTDLCIGTVDAVDPLEITISTAMETHQIRDMDRAATRPRRTRSGLPAPMFCPV